MNSIIKIVTQNRFFYSLNFVLTITILCLLFSFSRADGFIWLNQFHSSFLNYTFENITFLGDGSFTFLLFIFILVFFKNHRKLAFILLLSYISSGLFAQIIKNCISSPRPSVFFEIHHYKYYLDTFATSRIGFHSFPSGHTASFFSLATVLSNYCNRRYICFSMIILSALVGYSRIYLAHHFLIDVFAGSIIGVLFGSLSVVWYNQIINNPFVKNKLERLKQINNIYPNPSLSEQ